MTIECRSLRMHGFAAIAASDALASEAAFVRERNKKTQLASTLPT